MQRLNSEETDLEKITREEAEIKRSRHLDDAIKSVLSTRQGRRFFYALMGQCHFGRSAFAGNADHTNAFAGRQLVGEWAIELMNENAPEAYGLMLKEAKEDLTNDREHAEQQPRPDDSNSEFGADRSADQPA